MKVEAPYECDLLPSQSVHSSQDPWVILGVADESKGARRNQYLVLRLLLLELYD